jgi:hypothetical protein
MIDILYLLLGIACFAILYALTLSLDGRQEKD